MENPIFLVHGFWDKYAIFDSMAKTLNENGFKVFHKLNLTPNNGKNGIEKLAAQLQNYIEENTTADQKITIVAFSMGGLVSRYYIQNIMENEKVTQLITIATPHFGTHVANIFKYKACIQMRPKSDFLKELNRNIFKLERLSFTSIWAKFDTTIIPNSSSRLPFGKEVILPFGIHPLLPSNKRVIKEVLKAIVTRQN